LIQILRTTTTAGLLQTCPQLQVQVAVIMNCLTVVLIHAIKNINGYQVNKYLFPKFQTIGYNYMGKVLRNSGSGYMFRLN